MVNTLARRIDPTRVRYIKLGEAGCWERECIERGTVRIGFGSGQPDRFALCQAGQWAEIAHSFTAEGCNNRTAKRFANELRLFFEDNGSTLWITFVGETLYWGVTATDSPEPHADGESVWRPIRDGWQSTDLHGERLTKDRLSGALTKLAAYRGTSCTVDVRDYVIRRINGQKMPEVERALAAVQEMKTCLLGLMRLLTFRDFETLVDLVFSTSGWRRVGVVGGRRRPSTWT